MPQYACAGPRLRRRTPQPPGPCWKDVSESVRWQETSDIPVNVLLRQAALLILDGDGLGLAGALVGGGNPHDTVGVNLEGDLNLRNTARRGRDTSELELAEEVVVLRQRALALVDLNQDGGLVVSGGREAVDMSDRHAKQARTPRTSGTSSSG